MIRPRITVWFSEMFKCMLKTVFLFLQFTLQNIHQEGHPVGKVGLKTLPEFKENDKTFEFIKHVSMETSVILSQSKYKAMEAEFIISRKCHVL